MLDEGRGKSWRRLLEGMFEEVFDSRAVTAWKDKMRAIWKSFKKATIGNIVSAKPPQGPSTAPAGDQQTVLRPDRLQS